MRAGRMIGNCWSSVAIEWHNVLGMTDVGRMMNVRGAVWHVRHELQYCTQLRAMLGAGVAAHGATQL